METFDYNAKIAILRILQEIMNADNFVHENELDYLYKIMTQFKLDTNHISEVNKLEMAEALDEVRTFTPEQKIMTARMMGKMVIIDHDINYNEVLLYNDICHSCDIDNEFNVGNYEECSLSGPFVNPEDIMEMI